MASRQPLITRIEDTGTSFISLPCQALHGYMVISAHRVEVEVDADEPARAPPTGAAAAALPAGANSVQCYITLYIYLQLMWQRQKTEMYRAKKYRDGDFKQPLQGIQMQWLHALKMDDFVYMFMRLWQHAFNKRWVSYDHGLAKGREDTFQPQRPVLAAGRRSFLSPPSVAFLALRFSCSLVFYMLRLRRPPAAQRWRPRSGVRSQVRRHLPLLPRGGRW
jgi:hypothetical protein